MITFKDKFCCLDGADGEQDIPALLHQEGGQAHPGAEQSHRPHRQELHLDCNPGGHRQVPQK